MLKKIFYLISLPLIFSLNNVKSFLYKSCGDNNDIAQNLILSVDPELPQTDYTLFLNADLSQEIDNGTSKYSITYNFIPLSPTTEDLCSEIAKSNITCPLNNTIASESKGSVAVPAKLLLEILKTFPEQPLTFTVEENSTIEISSNSGKYALAYSPGSEFPKSVNLDNPSTTLVPAEVLATAISKTIFAAGNDDLRPVMSGVFFQFSPEGLTFVATDAHKLVRYKRSDIVSTANGAFILPKKPLNLLKANVRGDEEVLIEFLWKTVELFLIREVRKRG